MKKYITIFSLIAFFQCNIIIGQNSTRPYIGFTSINNINIGFHKMKNNTTFYGLEGGFYCPLKKQMYYNGLSSPFRIVNDIGFNVSSFIDFTNDINLEKLIEIRLEYSYLKSNKFIYDANQGFIRPQNGEAKYSEFKENYNNLSVLMTYYREFDWDEKFNYYFSFGFRFRFVNRQYSIEGTDLLTLPSDRKENLKQFAPTINIGIKYFFCKIK